MTQAPVYYDDPALDPAYGYGYETDAAALEYAQATAPVAPRYIARTRWLFAPFLIPLGLCGVSYMAGGQPLMTDVGFMLLALLCAIYFVRELLVFPYRFGVGGLLLFGGTLLWFCY